MKEKTRTCPVCSGSDISSSVALYDDRYGFPGKHTLARCVSCDHLFLLKSFSHGELKTLYTGRYPQSSNYENFLPYEEKRGFLAWLNGEKSAAFRHVPKNVRVLDIGCGLGETLGYHQSRGCEAHGIDVDKNLGKIAKKYHYSAVVGPFERAHYKKDYFDYITLDQVIEHIIDPVDFLRRVKRILKPGGTLIISTPNFSSWSCKILGARSFLWHVPYHLQFFTQKTMKKLGERVGLELTDSKTLTHSEWTFYQMAHVLTFPQEGQHSEFLDSPRTKRSWLSQAKIASVFAFHLTHVTHIFTRLVDRVGWGDNGLYFFTKK